MPQLYNLMAGCSKDKLKVVMTDKLKAVENYKEALERTKHRTTKLRHLAIEPAAPTADVNNKRRTNAWTNYNKPGPARVR